MIFFILISTSELYGLYNELLTYLDAQWQIVLVLCEEAPNDQVKGNAT
jgi:hypothetical protein